MTRLLDLPQIHWNQLRVKLNITEKDPELLVIGAVLTKDGVIEQLPWIVVDGILDHVEPGDYSVVIKNIAGEVLEEVPFGVEFISFEEPFGEQEVDDFLIGMAVPYPTGAVLVEIMAPDGEKLAVIDPVVKTLRDAVQEITDACFIGDPSEERSRMDGYVTQMEALLENNKYHEARQIIETELASIVESSIAIECEQAAGLETSKQDLLGLIAKTIPRIEVRIVETDADGDGIWDDADTCPDSDIGEVLVIKGCDTGVVNFVMENGCSISDEVAACEPSASNHGQFVSCVSHMTNRLKEEGVVTKEEKGDIQSCAAQASE